MIITGKGQIWQGDVLQLSVEVLVYAKAGSATKVSLCYFGNERGIRINPN